jgi:hypothetical protein
MATGILPRDSVVLPAVIPWPIVKLAHVRTLASRETDSRQVHVRRMGYRVGSSPALAIVPAVGPIAAAVERTVAGEELVIEAGAEARQMAARGLAVPLAVDPVV